MRFNTGDKVVVIDKNDPWYGIYCLILGYHAYDHSLLRVLNDTAERWIGEEHLLEADTFMIQYVKEAYGENIIGAVAPDE